MRINKMRTLGRFCMDTTYRPAVTNKLFADFISGPRETFVALIVCDCCLGGEHQHCLNHIDGRSCDCDCGGQHDRRVESDDMTRGRI